MIRLLEDKDWGVVNVWLYELAKQSFGNVIVDVLNKKVREDFEKEPEGFVVSEEQGNLNGFLWFSKFPEKKSAFIHGIYVDQAYRGKGISDQLIDYLEKLCKSEGIVMIDLNVTVNLEPAIKFYKRRGFEVKRHFMSRKLE